MAQSGFTPISIYYSSTATNVPTAGNLVAGELAINTNDGILYYKDSSGVVQKLATKGGVGTSSTTQVLYNSSGLIAGSANFVYDGYNLGLGGSLNTWETSTYRALQISTGVGTSSFVSRADSTNGGGLVLNGYYSSTGWKYVGSSYSTLYLQSTGTHQWYTSAAGTAGNAITFSEVMRIDTSGNVGIGTTSPSTSLSIADNATAANTKITISRTALGTTATYSSTELGTTTNSPMDIITNGSTRMRIDSSGYLLVNTTASVGGAARIGVLFAGNATNGINIQDSTTTSGAVFQQFSNSAGTAIGNISRVTTTNAVAYNTTSDQRLKSNIEDASPVLDKLMNVKVRQFDWTDGNLHQDAGFIAQELAPVLSGIVTEGKTKEDMWQMDYSRLTPYLVKAIQELNAEVQALKQQLGK